MVTTRLSSLVSMLSNSSLVLMNLKGFDQSYLLRLRIAMIQIKNNYKLKIFNTQFLVHIVCYPSIYPPPDTCSSPDIFNAPIEHNTLRPIYLITLL